MFFAKHTGDLCLNPGSDMPQLSKILTANIYILGVFTEKPYSKPLERNVVYIPIITLSHAMSHDFKWRQNKP